MLKLLFVFGFFNFQVAGWEIFTKTTFEWQYMEELGMQAEIPVFDEKIKSLEGKEITLTGYYLPVNVSSDRVILSKQPYASCFFCGGGVGLESVAEVQFADERPFFKLDDLVTVKGKLKLNEKEYGHLVFILTDAELIKS
ncbi:MAG: hypothetical protein AAF789_07455 [Bacteroidota bacterium]